ncbi:alpha-N-arabinofuranosidase [Treponema primitia]|uniref:arabinosylfuranosidase ArfA n=1 Tax=Treponema primitia TaxID=88058 RepID=UPI0002554FD9|nr:alpha-N-arabinofuranosidase [Treponema primitia]
MGDKLTILLDKNYTIADVGSRLYSTFVEHLGRCVYEGIYEPGHPSADSKGFREDVRTLVKELHFGALRYPGGNFVSGYDWLDGIGPREKRPRRLDYAWSSIETNEIGIDEFCDYAKSVGSEVMYAVNLGTGTPQNAGYTVEYANFPGGTYYSDLRIQNGHKDPHNIKLWCLGNEMDGPWQTCHLDAVDYGKKALEAAKIMKWADPSIELTLCGSATTLLPTYPEWDRIVLEHAYDKVDFLSLHRYYENFGNEVDFLASFYEMDTFIKTIAATADYVKAVKRSKKTMMLSFDEWNIWYQAKTQLKQWEIAPHILEDHYSLLDALAFAGLLCTLINNSDRVRIACLAQMVNVIAPIITEKGGKAIRQTTFYPFSLAAKYCTGTVLKPLAKIPTIESAAYGAVPSIACAVTHNAERNEVAVICVNIADKTQEIEFDMRSFGVVRWIEHVTMQGNPDAVNTFAAPETVKPSAVDVPRDSTGTPQVSLPPKSFHLLRFAC